MATKVALTIFFVLAVDLVTSQTLLAKTETDADIKMREQMVKMSRDLGVTCVYCHNPENFKESKNKNFAVAAQHMKITKLLNSDKGFGGKPEVTCFVCHQGKAKFEYELSGPSQLK